jgi:ribosome modulation factor
MTEAYDDGYQAYIEGAEHLANPYNWTDGHDMHPDEYFEWGSGWRDAYLQFNRAG